MVAQTKHHLLLRPASDETLRVLHLRDFALDRMGG